MLCETEKKKNHQEIRKWHNFVPMVLCYSPALSPGGRVGENPGNESAIIKALYVICHYYG